MMVSKLALSRRTVLKGIGASLALPFLDAMIPALTATAQAAKPVRRLGFVFFPMGMNPALWTPTGTGKLELSPSLSALAPHVDYVTVLTNLQLKNAHPHFLFYRFGVHNAAACGHHLKVALLHRMRTVSKLPLKHEGYGFKARMRVRPPDRLVSFFVELIIHEQDEWIGHRKIILDDSARRMTRPEKSLVRGWRLN